MHIVYLDFSIALDVLSHCILIAKLLRYGLFKWMNRWLENWVDHWAQGVIINGTNSSWQLVSSGISWTQPNDH